jgi:hypothetical protein
VGGALVRIEQKDINFNEADDRKIHNAEITKTTRHI